MSLIASNIPSFAAGLDLWGRTKNTGVASEKSRKCELLSHEQKLGDGVLEFISFSGAIAFGVERVGHF